MSEINRKQQEHFNLIKKALASGDEEMLADALRNKNPLAIREDLATTLGQHVNENYDKPLNIFENQKILEDIPVSYTENLPKGSAGQYIKDRGLYLPKEDIGQLSKQTGVKLHEYGHANDALKGFEQSQPFKKTKAILGSTGLEAAESAIGKHHDVGFFEKEALKDLLQNRKLKAVLPMLKAAGIGATVYGMSQGDVFAADPTGLLQTDEIGKGSDILPSDEQIKKERFNQTMKRLLNK